MTYVEKEAGSFGDKLLPLDAFDSITHALIVHNLTQPWVLKTHLGEQATSLTLFVITHSAFAWNPTTQGKTNFSSLNSPQIISKSE